MRSPLFFALLMSAGALACTTTDAPDEVGTLQQWGQLRNVMRDGETFRRVRLSQVARPGTWGVGALEGLGGEVTVLDGVATIAEATDGELELRDATSRDFATLLVLASAEGWAEREVVAARAPDVDVVLDAGVRALGFDPVTKPVAIRLEGEFDQLELHVIAGNCPIANPDGPAPLRWSGGGARGTLVGVFAPGRAGDLTHHTHPFHLHALVTTPDGRTVSGHVDEVAFAEGVRLLAPALAAPGR